MFIIANNPNGYGVDRCLASGASCGAAIATAYCRSRDFSQAVSCRKVSKGDITGAAPAGVGSCGGNSCATTSPSSVCADRVALTRKLVIS